LGGEDEKPKGKKLDRRKIEIIFGVKVKVGNFLDESKTLKM
jgi:hypothetical protein